MSENTPTPTPGTVVNSKSITGKTYIFTDEDRARSAEARKNKAAAVQAAAVETYWRHRESGAQPYAAANKAGISWDDLRTYQQGEEWRRREEMTDAATVEDIVGALKQAALQGNVKAAEHMLSVLNPDRWGRIGKQAAVQITNNNLSLNGGDLAQLQGRVARLFGRYLAQLPDPHAYVDSLIAASKQSAGELPASPSRVVDAEVISERYIMPSEESS